MTQWYVKDLATLTGVTVQTLHHYDRIELLQPSLRLDNGYRIYSEKDLLKLQQIIALKFFGFELSQIKTLLVKQTDALEHFNNQVKVLKQKAETFATAAKTLGDIINTVDHHKSIPWETIIQFIEVYKMTENLQHNWVKDIFTPDELKEYAQFEHELKTNRTPEEKAKFEQQWQKILNEIKSHLNDDPDSQIGIEMGKKSMQWTNALYGKKYAHLRNKKWEKGFGEGIGLDDVGFTPEIVDWLGKAVNAYWWDRINKMLKQIGKSSDQTLITEWNQSLDDMCGDETKRKQQIYEKILNDDRASPEAKSWLIELQKSQ